MSALTGIDLLREMLAIPSPSTHESELAGFLADAMTGLGLRGHVDAVGNVIGETGTGVGPTVMLLGHMDTVDGLIPVRRSDDRLYGRGAVDAKGPLAAMITAVARCRDFPGRLVVIGAVEEETPSSRGAVHIRQTWAAPHALIVGEPSGWNSVVLGYKGKVDLLYQVHRPATHPSNPVEKATDAAVAFYQLAVAAIGPQPPSHAAFDRPGLTLVRISGDLTDAELELSYRVPPGFDLAGLLEALRDGSADAQLKLINAVPAVRVDHRDPVVQALRAAIRQAGGEPRSLLKTATSDMNTLAEVWPGVPMATYGPGDSRLDHADDEHILIADFARGAEVLTTALGRLARMSR